MPRQTPNPQTIFHLVPHKLSVKTREILLHPDNEPFVSLSRDENGRDENGQEADGLEIGYHVPARPRPQVIVEVGRDADLILPGSTISKIHFSFEIHPESRQIVFYDRSRLRNTKIGPGGFRTDGDFRQVILQPGTAYQISVGGEGLNQYIFNVVWLLRKPEKVSQETERGYQVAEARVQNPRWARTVEEGPTELPSWYNTRLHTPTVGGVLRTTEIKRLGEGAFGEVWKAVDLDSGRFVAVKKMKLPPRLGLFPSREEDLLRREVKILSNISHKNIVEYLGSTGWDTQTVHIYMSLKTGNVCELLEEFPAIRSNKEILLRLLHEMLEALDYLAFRGWCHRDVKPENILYTSSGNGSFVFQLADFGLANQQRLADTLCGSPLYMAPEVMYQTHAQSPKLDVWSLFVVIGVLTQAGGLHDPLACYREVLPRVRAAAVLHSTLSPMAQENPDARASAAQMLVQCFDGQGLSTPRNRVRPIPDPASVLAQPQAPEPREPDQRLKTPNQTVKNVKTPAGVNRKRANYMSPNLVNHNVPRRGVRPKGLAEIERRGESWGLPHFT